jgi:hypothetical protein
MSLFNVKRRHFSVEERGAFAFRSQSFAPSGNKAGKKNKKKLPELGFGLVLFSVSTKKDHLTSKCETAFS